MLSNVLFEAGRLLDQYITDDYWPGQYGASLPADVSALWKRIDEIGFHLDHALDETRAYCVSSTSPKALQDK